MSLFNLFRQSLMNDAGGDTGGAAPAAAAADTAPAATAAPAATDPGTLLTGNEANQAPTTPQTPEQKAEADAKAAEGKKPGGFGNAPESYAEFKMPEGVNADSELMTNFAATAKELGLSQEQAQKLVDLQAKSVEGQEAARREMLEQAITKQSEQWVNQIKADPELGGEKFEATVATASKAMQAFGSPELRALLNESGLGNNPELIRLFHKIGSAISEDKMVLPGNSVSGKPKPEDVFYGKGN